VAAIAAVAAAILFLGALVSAGDLGGSLFAIVALVVVVVCAWRTWESGLYFDGTRFRYRTVFADRVFPCRQVERFELRPFSRNRRVKIVAVTMTSGATLELPYFNERRYPWIDELNREANDLAKT